MHTTAQSTNLLIGTKVVVPYMESTAIGEVYQPEKDQTVRVQLFLGVGSRQIVNVAVSRIEKATLVCEQRVYVEDPTRGWRFGRIISQVNSDVPRLRSYQIRFPEGESTQLTEDQFHVFADIGHIDPIDSLMHGAHETPFFFNHRRRLVEELIKQRAACSGQSGLISSKIELYEHQCSAIERVLMDPRQRYLLADEVGLGKTIEAGVLVRQLRIDEPSARIQILAPDHLVAQWRAEIINRFSTNVFLDEQIKIAGYSAIGNIEASPDMLIIDEAHNLIRRPLPQDSQKRLEDLTRQAPRLLLLSATPVLGHERELLTLLSWLEPNIYSVEQLDEFEQRVRHRQTIGRELLALRPDMRGFPLRRTVKRLRELFSDDTHSSFNDERVLQLCEQLSQATNDSELESERVPELILNLRNHISECYRLHRRMIRNRRSSINAGLAKRSAPTIEYEFEQERKRDIRESLENWRNHAAEIVSNSPESDVLTKRFLPIFATVVQACYSWSGFAERVVNARLGLPSQDLPSEIRELVQSVGLFDGEHELLENLAADLRRDVDYDRIQLLVDMLASKTSKDRVVVFTHHACVCAEVAKRLRQHNSCISSCNSQQASQVNDDELSRFQSTGGILVCDPTVEEGANLQSAHLLVHFDLPLNPFAIEQRIGRLDRISRTIRTVPSTVLLSEDEGEGYDEAWFTLLNQGLGVFETPISDLHLLVERILPNLLVKLFLNGIHPWQDAVEQISKDVETQRRENDEQDVIDAIEIQKDERSNRYAELEHYEQDVSKFKAAVNGYLKNVCKIDTNRLQRMPTARKKSYFEDSDVLLRKDWFQKLLPSLVAPAGFDRIATISDPKRSLLRLGHPVIDSLREFIERDDRGKSFVFWRKAAGIGPCRPWFLLNFVIEANQMAIANGISGSASLSDRKEELQRLADGFLPPRFVPVYMNDEYDFVTDSEMIQTLHRPYDKSKGDRNLSDKRLHILRETIDYERWSFHCEQVRERAVTSVYNSSAFQQFVTQAGTRVQKFFDRRLDQTSIASRHLDPAIQRELLDGEKSVMEATYQAVVKPSVRLDSAGVILLSEEPCPSSY